MLITERIGKPALKSAMRRYYRCNFQYVNPIILKTLQRDRFCLLIQLKKRYGNMASFVAEVKKDLPVVDFNF